MTSIRPRTSLSSLTQKHQHKTGIEKPFRKIHISFWLGIVSIGISGIVYLVFVPLLWWTSGFGLFLSIMGLASSNKYIQTYLENPDQHSNELYNNARVGRLVNMVAILLPLVLITCMGGFIVLVAMGKYE